MIVESDIVQIDAPPKSFAEMVMQNSVNAIDTAALVQGARYTQELVQGIIAGKPQYYPGISAINVDMDTLQEIVDEYNRLSGLIGAAAMEHFWQQNFGEKFNFKAIRPKLPHDAEMN